MSCCQHCLQKRQSRCSVISEINLRSLHAFASFDQSGEVHHSIETTLTKGLFDQRPIRDIALYKRGVFSNCRTLAMAKIVEHRNCMPLSKQNPRDCASDVPCSTCYQNLH